MIVPFLRRRRPMPVVDASNPLHRLLDDHRLPWRTRRAKVEGQHGTTRDPLSARDVVFLRDAVRAPGFLQPWRADVFDGYAPDLPVVRFGAVAWHEDDADANLGRLAAHFAEQLGPVAPAREWNTLACRWRAGTASLELKVWPPAWQTPAARNDAHEREPRLRTAVQVTLLTGFRLPPDERERRWLSGFGPIAAVTPLMLATAERMADTPPADVELEYARDPAGVPPAVHGRVGAPPHAEALILATHQLFVVRRADLIGFDVTRSLPAKGGGGSSLIVRCRTPCSAMAFKKLRITDDPDPDGATALGRRLAERFDRPCDVGRYFLDA
ncbi:hypothetical protein [Sphingomonas bacterium]|uniref:hypothetical protein n=1 Tax=Sphingomonas bacterium TaxID=1895847 RepID=UPI001576DC20|nr:hypothetical protein [Sphingomonas bacterium]